MAVEGKVVLKINGLNVVAPASRAKEIEKEMKAKAKAEEKSSSKKKSKKEEAEGAEKE